MCETSVHEDSAYASSSATPSAASRSRFGQVARSGA